MSFLTLLLPKQTAELLRLSRRLLNGATRQDGGGTHWRTTRNA
jgi:hypothetical protein